MHEAAIAVTAVLGPVLGGAAAAAGAWVSWTLRKPRAGAPPGDLGPALAALQPPEDQDARSDLQRARVVVLVFMSNSCPGVKAYDARLIALQERFRGSGVMVVGINPVDERLYPAESTAHMAAAARERGLNFPYLKDPSQEVARRCGAVCTPQAFVLDAARRVRYRGRIDDAFVPARVRRPYLQEAVEDVLASREVRVPETAPLGCAIEGLPARDRPARRTLKGEAPGAAPS